MEKAISGAPNPPGGTDTVVIAPPDDFISQSSFEQGIALPEDALGHNELAQTLLKKMHYLAAGSIISVQGSWGSGKTDLLTRLTLSALKDESGFCDVIWINPWQYGTADLLTPIVISLLERLPASEVSDFSRYKQAATSIIRAGINFGLKAAANTIPGANLLDLIADPVDNIIDALTRSSEPSGPQQKPDPDPVATMGSRFRELVSDIVKSRTPSANRSILICIDDLDRCLPDRQVALLEAIRFLTSAGASVLFAIALDPTLAREAVSTHYSTPSFNADRYLDKLFHLRINLPSLTNSAVTSLISKAMTRVRTGGNGVGLRTLAELVTIQLDFNTDEFAASAAAGIRHPFVRNPRLIRRILDRLYLALTLSEEPWQLSDREAVGRLVIWLAICEQWPQLRSYLQDAEEDFSSRYSQLLAIPSEGSPPAENRQDGIWDLSHASAARTLLHSQAASGTRVAQDFMYFDKQLLAVGL